MRSPQSPFFCPIIGIDAPDKKSQESSKTFAEGRGLARQAPTLWVTLHSPVGFAVFVYYLALHEKSTDVTLTP